MIGTVSDQGSAIDRRSRHADRKATTGGDAR